MCILLVEDEFLIRLILTEELADAGFEVREAENGDQAARLIENPPTDFSLLITDIHMPGRLNGMQLARLMRARHPDIPFSYIPGRPDVLAAAGPLGAKEALVSKPFTSSDILGAARMLLATR